MPNKNESTGSKGVWGSLNSKKPRNLETKETRIQETKSESKELKKPKRMAENGETFEKTRTFDLTETTSRRLNMAKALSNNLTLNEILDEALNLYFGKHEIP